MGCITVLYMFIFVSLWLSLDLKAKYGLLVKIIFIISAFSFPTSDIIAYKDENTWLVLWVGKTHYFIWLTILVLSIFTDSPTTFVLLSRLIYVSFTVVLDRATMAIHQHMLLCALTCCRVCLSNLHLSSLKQVLQQVILFNCAMWFPRPVLVSSSVRLHYFQNNRIASQPIFVLSVFQEMCIRDSIASVTFWKQELFMKIAYTLF